MSSRSLARFAMVAGFATAVAGCGTQEKPPDVQAQIARLQSGPGEDQWKALSHLQSLAGEGAAAVPDLRALLKQTKDDTLRAEIARTLGSMGPAAGAAAPDLMRLLDSKDGWVRYCAAEALGKMGAGGLPALPKLIALAKGRDRNVAAVAAEAARRLERLRTRK